jgi:hypothetical protein
MVACKPLVGVDGFAMTLNVYVTESYTMIFTTTFDCDASLRITVTTTMQHHCESRARQMKMPEAPAAAAKSEGKDGDLSWTENSKTMFEECCAATPWLVRHFTRSGFTKGLRAKGCGTVTEQDMFDVAREVTPPAHLEKTLGILNKNKTTDAS